MSINGVRQLKKLSIRYSDYDGSSKGIREWIRLNILPFAENNPDLFVRTNLKRNKHPCLVGAYRNGNIKTIGVKNLTVEEIDGYVLDLRNQVGRKMAEGYYLPVVSKKPSIQGEWHERMDLIDLKFEVKSI